MENMMMRRNDHENRSMAPASTTPSSALSNVNKDSHTISKAKPKIRIIHIFAPEIIKTDVANFRELVQRLTGKPAQEIRGCKKKARIICPRSPPDDHLSPEPRITAPVVAKKMEFRTGFLAAAAAAAGCLETRERAAVKEEEGMWINGGTENSGGGFLSGFGDLDGFIQELGEFPLFPLDATHHMHGFEEAQLA